MKTKESRFQVHDELTAKGQALQPALAALKQWSHDYCPETVARRNAV